MLLSPSSLFVGPPARVQLLVASRLAALEQDNHNHDHLSLELNYDPDEDEQSTFLLHAGGTW
jgi:hypothetical protein